jgi:TolA-binding protein
VAPYVEDDRAATLGDIRGLRRWLVVTAVWAAAATALGVIALIQANKNDNDNTDRARSAADLARVQRDLAGRIDALKAQVDDLPTSDDVSKLDGRIKDLEKKADTTGSNIEKLNGRLDDLEKRVDTVEQQQSQQQTNTTTTP